MVRTRALDGFDQLFAEEYDAVVSAAYQVTGHRAIATEVTQDAFAEGFARWRKVNRYDRPGAWVRRVAIRNAVKVRDRDRRRIELMVEAAADLPPRQDHGLTLDLELALDTLSPHQRAMVVLHYFEDLPVDEAAAVLGYKPATASVHLHRARGRLATALAGEETIDAGRG